MQKKYKFNNTGTSYKWVVEMGRNHLFIFKPEFNSSKLNSTTIDMLM